MNGLLLAGGRSTRMGKDKSLLKWHGKEQRYYMADLLRSFCNEVFISCRTEQAHTVDGTYKVIQDKYEYGGPLGAIISAFHQNKETGWLVVACDLPLLDRKTINYLVQNRDDSLTATTFESPYDHLPEPLITIWEPGSLPNLEDALFLGRSCPRKVLLNTNIKILQAPEPSALTNANTPEDQEKIIQLLKNGVYVG